jgi:hypothetical protein
MDSIKYNNESQQEPRMVTCSVLQKMLTPSREHFDYCWPGDAKITALDVKRNQICFTFDNFMISLDDPWNETGWDLYLGECMCCFDETSKVELRVWPNDREYRLEPDISRLVGCILENSGDMPSEQGHYFELTGFCGAEWFELHIYSDRYNLFLCDADDNRIKGQDRWLLVQVQNAD